MAQFNADILLKVVETEVDRSIKRIERKFAALEKSAELSLTVKGEQKLTGLSKRVDALGRSLERIKPTAIFGGVATGAAVAGTGVQKLVEALASLPKGGILEPLVGAIREFGANADAALGPATKFAAALTDFAASAPATAGGIALASGALFAFAPALKQAAGDAVALGKALFNLEKAGLIVKKLDQSFELTRAGILAFAKEAGSLNVLTQELKDAKKELNDMDRIAEGFTEATQRQIDAEKAVNNELIKRKRIYTELNAGRQRILDNIEASQVSREASGFADSGPSAIDKSIRRQREKPGKTCPSSPIRPPVRLQPVH